MSSATPDLRLCAFATLIQPLRARDSLGEKNSFYIGGKTKSHFRKVASMPTEGALRSERAESALGPARHGSFRAVRFPEARGNSRRPVLALLRAAELAPGPAAGRVGGRRGRPGAAGSYVATTRPRPSRHGVPVAATWSNGAAEAPLETRDMEVLTDGKAER